MLESGKADPEEVELPLGKVSDNNGNRGETSGESHGGLMVDPKAIRRVITA